jgi:hypothetical protein
VSVALWIVTMVLAMGLLAGSITLCVVAHGVHKRTSAAYSSYSPLFSVSYAPLSCDTSLRAD